MIQPAKKTMCLTVNRTCDEWWVDTFPRMSECGEQVIMTKTHKTVKQKTRKKMYETISPQKNNMFGCARVFIPSPGNTTS